MKLELQVQTSHREKNNAGPSLIPLAAETSNR